MKLDTTRFHNACLLIVSSCSDVYVTAPNHCHGRIRPSAYVRSTTPVRTSGPAAHSDYINASNPVKSPSRSTDGYGWTKTCLDVSAARIQSRPLLRRTDLQSRRSRHPPLRLLPAR